MDIIITIFAWALVGSVFGTIIYFGCKVFLAVTRRIVKFPENPRVQFLPDNISEIKAAGKRIEKQNAKIHALPEEEQLAYYYHVIQDLGYGDIISSDEYAAAAQESGKGDALEDVLTKHKKAFSWEKYGEVGDAFLTMHEMIPECGFESSDDYPQTITEEDGSLTNWIRGTICGESIDIWMGSRRVEKSWETQWKDLDACISPVEFVYDVVNPIISEKAAKQFMCLEPGGITRFTLVDNERVDAVRANPYFAEEEYWKHFYGYRNTRYTFQ